jgi:organic radical activating enzyme
MTTAPSNLIAEPGSLTIPIAEIFTSIHGEGYWAGTPMTFIRLAGCSVGRTYAGNNESPFPVLQSGIRAFECTAFDGRKFPCDTDYRKTETKTLNEIYNSIPPHIKHVCITGGEPLMHREIDALCAYLTKYIIHIETSGTISKYLPNVAHVTCSPKFGYNPDYVGDADEVRIMVDDKLTDEALAELMLCVHPQYQHVYFSPLCVNDVSTPDSLSLQRCLELVHQYPNTKISIQMHKVLGVR